MFNLIVLMLSCERLPEEARTAQAARSLFKLLIFSLLIRSRFQLLITPTGEDGPICKALDLLLGREDIIN
jgi:hypothetical protein